MQNNDLAAILESKITGNTVRIGRTLAEEIVKALKGEGKMSADEIARELRENADWCGANEYEIPLCMGDNQREAAGLIESMQSQLAESQRRERAAVEDLEGAGACFTCKHFRRNGGDCFGAGRCRLDGIEIWPCNEPGFIGWKCLMTGERCTNGAAHRRPGKEHD